MGQLLSSLWRQLVYSGNYKIVMVGLDNAGKTTTLFQLHMGEAVDTAPTLGSNVERVRSHGLNFEVWDLGAQANLRPSWSTYYTSTDAVILVVDATDAARLSVVRTELTRLLDDPLLAGAPVLVLANKQDLPAALGAAALGEALGLVAVKDHSWHVQPSCALTGAGLQEGLAWVARHVRSREAGGSATAPAQ